MPKRPNLSKWHVLVVDDDEASAAVESDMLQLFKANTYVALSGSSALAMVATLAPLTLIILDLKMPSMSGWEVRDRLRALPELDRIPIVAVTAHAFDADRQRVFEAGFDGYITKPIQINTFLVELTGFITQKMIAQQQS